MLFPSRIRNKKPASRKPLWVRPVLECLEDRSLLAGGFLQVNLASDLPGLAQRTDPNLVNPWGIVFSPTGPFWLANNGTDVADILDGNGQPFPLAPAIPPAVPSGEAPSGIAFNHRAGFVVSENGVGAPSRFLFATENGKIFGWSDVVDPARALLAIDRSDTGAVYKGLALAADAAGRSFLFVADFSHGTIDVFDQAFRQVAPPGSFQDPNLPAGFAPFNIQNVNNRLFVAYARRNGTDELAGAGLGFIDVYNLNGDLLSRFASGGALNAPWGIVQAPANFGSFGGAVLIGNNGDGHINAFNPATGVSLGALTDGSGVPIAISHLWSLTFGNGHAGGDSNTLFFTAGVDNETHGLFGAVQAPGRHGADTAGTGPFDPTAPGEPGDYPLPPRDGPALQTRNTDPSLPTVDLLPVRESSLVLLPTLSTISPSAIRTADFVPTASTGGAVSFLGIIPGPNSIDTLVVAGGTLAPDKLLDVNSSRLAPQAASVHLLDPVRQSECSEVSFQELETALSNEKGPEAMASQTEVDRSLADLTESTDESESQQKLPKTPGNGCGVTLFVAACVSIVGTYWVSAELGNTRGSPYLPYWPPRR
jgi:uncharacterized protein (TIGR03118 family)